MTQMKRIAIKPSRLSQAMPAPFRLPPAALPVTRPARVFPVIVGGLLLAIAAPLASQAQTYPTAQSLLSSGTNVTGETIRYPTEGAAKVDAAIVSIAPGMQTGWHRHGVPNFAYILSGEITVDYGEKGKRTYKTGDGFLEAMNWSHNGHNSSTEPTRILVVYMTAEGGAAKVLPGE